MIKIEKNVFFRIVSNKNASKNAKKTMNKCRSELIEQTASCDATTNMMTSFRKRFVLKKSKINFKLLIEKTIETLMTRQSAKSFALRFSLK